MLLLRVARYFRPHVLAVVAGVSFMWTVRWLSSMGGACRTLCYPPITIGLGVIAGLLGAQLYRSEHPLPRMSRPSSAEP